MVVVVAVVIIVLISIPLWVSHRGSGSSSYYSINKHPALGEPSLRGFKIILQIIIEPTAGLLRSDGKRPDGLTLVPWQSGKALCWDVTVTCPLADSYVTRAACETGSAAELSASRKEEKYMIVCCHRRPLHI